MLTVDQLKRAYSDIKFIECNEDQVTTNATLSVNNEKKFIDICREAGTTTIFVACKYYSKDKLKISTTQATKAAAELEEEIRDLFTNRADAWNAFIDSQSFVWPYEQQFIASINGVVISTTVTDYWFNGPDFMDNITIYGETTANNILTKLQYISKRPSRKM